MSKNETTYAARKYAENQLSPTPPIECGLSVGDVVDWENDYGVKWTHTIIGFSSEVESYGGFIHMNTEAYWFPHKLSDIRMVNGEPVTA